MTCAEYRARNVNAGLTDAEKETLTLMKDRDNRRCPNCMLVVEKDGGCNSMYCEGCKTYFSWAMAASAVPGSKRFVDDDMMADVAVVCEMEALEKLAERRDSGKVLPPW